MPDPIQILVVDDDPVSADLLEEVLGKEGYAVRKAGSGEAAIELGREIPFDVVVSDIQMMGVDGLGVLRAFRKIRPETLVVLITAFGSIDTAVAAIQEGAYDYISKPFKIEEIQLAVRRALDHRRLLKEYRQLKQEVDEHRSLQQIVGSSRGMLEVYKLVARVAPTQSTVLIQGESGTGKELIARAVHLASPRFGGAFVAVNCSSIPENLLESELFGHVRGAFTGALYTKKGLIEEASGGTLFLDEVADMSLSMQAKLLRALQEQEVKRVGGTETLRVDVRVIAATNKDLEVLVGKGAFREDLFYRLNVVTMRLPPLRERREDVPLLAQFFLAKYNARSGKSVTEISEGALERLRGYDWPGNVRELEHVIERAVALNAKNVVLPEDLPEKVRAATPRPPEAGPEEGGTEMLSLEEMERRHIVQVLKRTGGNKARAAQILGIDRKTLHRKAQAYGISILPDA